MRTNFFHTKSDEETFIFSCGKIMQALVSKGEILLLGENLYYLITFHNFFKLSFNSWLSDTISHIVSVYGNNYKNMSIRLGNIRLCFAEKPA